MRVTRLKLANVRAVEMAEFHFWPGFNLVAGVNGVGKTTVLDALAVCFSAVVRHANRHPRYGRSFEADDIRVGFGALQAECDLECAGEEHGYLLHRFRDRNLLHGTTEWSRENEKTYNSLAIEEFYGGVPTDGTGGKPEGQVLAVLFSTNRSVAFDQPSRPGAAAGGVAAAFADALSTRRLRLGEFAAWMRVQQALSSERPAAKRMLAAFDKAVTRFLPDYRNLRPAGDDSGHTLLIDRGATPLAVRHLSDGERGILAMVLDLTRRLAQANPKLQDPAAEAEAVVLIDEIELHLHPGWQRRIVKNLTETFPKCQFIATTHSPQIIGEVEHDRIHIIRNGEVYSPTHSFGVDSSRVLEEIMDAPPRTAEIEELLKKVSQEVGKQQRYEEARELLAQLVDRLGEDDPEVTRIRILLDFMEGEE